MTARRSAPTFAGSRLAISITLITTELLLAAVVLLITAVLASLPARKLPVG